MRVGVSSRGNAWVSMGCLGWLFLGPFILAWAILCAFGTLTAEAYRAITGAAREARPEPTRAQLDRKASRDRVAGFVILAVCAAVAVVALAASL